MRYRCLRPAFAVLVALTTVVPAVAAHIQDAPKPLRDLAALAIRPGDIPEPGWRHEGAFMADPAGQAESVAAYRGDTSVADVATQLTAFGWRRMYLSAMDGPPGAGATPIAGTSPPMDRRIRSYITEYGTAAGAAAGFVYLEDESGIPTSEDLPITRSFGEQSELTRDAGTGADGRQFRSLDLTFRAGALVAGVTIVGYGNTNESWPDATTAEALAAVIEARLRSPEVAPGLGARVARLTGRPPAVVSYDDAYYRIAGADIPLADEDDEAAAARTRTYAGATDVYQLWQGANVGDSDGLLYGVTLLRFPDDAAASAWLDELPDVLNANPFYAAVQPLEAPVETVALGYVAGGGGPEAPRAVLVAVRVGSSVARVHVVPQGRLTDVPLAPVMELAAAAAACLAGPDCPDLNALPIGLGERLPASPVATSEG